MLRRRYAVLALVLSMVLSSVGASLQGGPGGGPTPTAGGLSEGGATHLASEVNYDFSVRNPLDQARGPEVAWVDVPVPPGSLTDAGDMTLLDLGSGTEVRSGHLPGDVTRHPDGSVHRVRLHFKDSWAAGETRDYRAVIGRTPQASGPSLSVRPSGEFVIVTDGSAQYQVHIEDSVFSQNQGLYYVYLPNRFSGEVRAHGSVLTRIGGNQLEPDQASFQMWWGRHTELEIHRSDLVVRVRLTYHRPEVVHWGPAGATVPQIVRYVDFVRAEVELTFYQGVPRVDARSRKVVDERFWNHNGFVMEFSAILGQGADWEGEYETVFGTSARKVMTATTQGPTWTRVTGTWQGVDVGSDAAPALGDLDGDGDLDMVLGSGAGNLTAWENVGSPTDPELVENASWAAGLPDLGSPTPALGDLDDDGDLDLLVGDEGGKLKVYRNGGGGGSPPSWSRWWGNFDRLGLGHHTAPCLGDADGDGDLDVVVGLRDGTLRGIVNVGDASSPAWSMDDGWVRHLNQGPTRSPAELHAVPHMADLEGDGDPDLLLGSDDGKVTYFENVGSQHLPEWTRLDVSLFAGVWSRSWVDANSTPVMADVDGDGDLDLLMGTQDGVMELYRLDGWTTPYRGHNNLQPLLNGTYRHMRDKDGNDGPFVVEGYADDFYGYYVLANPRNGYAALRYIPDFDRLAYKQEYYGDRFPFAGGNVSYYPYDPVATEYVTRAQITSNVFSGGVSGGTFISQTGTSAGFVMQPMTAMVHESDEVLVLDLQRRARVEDYDAYVEPLRRPLQVLSPVDLAALDIWMDPPAPGDGEPADLHVTYANLGRDPVDSAAARVEVTVGEGDEAWTRVYEEFFDSYRAGQRHHVVYSQVDTWGWQGRVEVTLTLDPDDRVNESDEHNNNASYVYRAEPLSLPWSKPTAATTGANTSLDPDAVVRRDGRLQVVWETCQGREDIDLEARAYDPVADQWDQLVTLVSDSHYAVEPDLALMGDVVHLAYSSNGRALERYYETHHGKYYWGEKFDLWTMSLDQGSWSPPARLTRAVDYDDSDQAPDIVYGAGALRVFHRNTHFQFYTNGNQMDNIPFQEMEVREARWTQATGWTANHTFPSHAGSQAWWGGPAAAAVGDGLVYVIYSREVGNSRWDLHYGIVREGSASHQPLQQSSGSDEFRPAVASGGQDPVLLVAYETDRNGNRDIVARWRAPSANPAQGWSAERMLTTDTASDMKPTVAYDGQGSYWVAWESFRTGNKDIFISRFDGEEWSGPYQVTTDHGSDESPVLTCDDQTGRVFVVWETDRHGMGNKDIYMRHMLPTAPRLSLGDVVHGQEDEPMGLDGSVTDAEGDFHHLFIDWGDGNSSVHRDLTANHSYERTGTYTARVTPVDRFGLRGDTVTVEMVVSNPAPVARLGGDAQGEEDSGVLLSAANSTDTPSDVGSLTVAWDMGDGTTTEPVPLAVGANRTHVYTSSGVYDVTVNVTDDDGDWSLAHWEVRVLNVPPVVEAWGRVDDLREDQAGEFGGRGTDTPSDMGRGLVFRWDWGDGSSSGDLNDPVATHAYARSGSYVARLTLTDDDGDTDTAEVPVTVRNVAPSVEVSGQAVVVEDGPLNLTATGDDTAHDREALEYRWDWGDGTSSDWSSHPNGTHGYASAGMYTVTVWVRDDDGEERSSVHSVVVSNVAPEAVATASPTLVPEGGPVHLTADGTWDTPSDLPGLSFRWEVGPEVVERFEFDHVFRASGMHTFTLTVTDDDGESSTAEVNVLVVNRPPLSRGWVSAERVTVGEALHFDASNSTDDPWDAGGLTYRWSMGDGTTISLAQAFHIYQVPGEYPIELVVTDGDGNSTRWNTTVTVLERESGPEGDGGLGLAAGAAAIIVVLLVLVFMFLMRSRRGPGADDGKEPLPPDEPEVGEGGPGTEVDEGVVEEESTEDGEAA